MLKLSCTLGMTVKSICRLSPGYGPLVWIGLIWSLLGSGVGVVHCADGTCLNCLTDYVWLIILFMAEIAMSSMNLLYRTWIPCWGSLLTWQAAVRGKKYCPCSLTSHPWPHRSHWSLILGLRLIFLLCGLGNNWMNLELEVGGVIAKLQVLGLPSGQLCPPCCSPLLTLNPSPMDLCHLFW